MLLREATHFCSCKLSSWNTTMNQLIIQRSIIQHTGFESELPDPMPISIHTNHSSIHSLICLTTGPTPLPKRFLHIVRSRASSFKWEYPLLSLRSSSSFLRLLPRLLVTSVSLIFPTITCFRRQFRRKMWPIQLAFRFHYHYSHPFLWQNRTGGLLYTSDQLVAEAAT